MEGARQRKRPRVQPGEIAVPQPPSRRIRRRTSRRAAIEGQRPLPLADLPNHANIPTAESSSTGDYDCCSTARSGPHRASAHGQADDAVIPNRGIRDSESRISGPGPIARENRENLPPGLPEEQGSSFSVGSLAADQNSSPQSTTTVLAPVGFTSQRFIDIDCDHENLRLCSTYAAEIYDNWRRVEVIAMPTTDFMVTLQTEINAWHRSVLINWFVEVAEELYLVPETLYLAVSYLDRFLSTAVVPLPRLQLVGVSCLFIAAKYEEIVPPIVKDFTDLTARYYIRKQILAMEKEILKKHNFRLAIPTIMTFLRRFFLAARAGYTGPVLQLKFLGYYLAELTLLEYECIHFLPSVVAASAVFVAKVTLDPESNPWNVTLQHYSGYRPSDLRSCVERIHKLHLNAGNTAQATREKYILAKFQRVADLKPCTYIPLEYFQDIHRPEFR